MQYFYCTINTGGDIMKKRVTYTLEEELIEQLKKVSEDTMIPQAKLVEKAIKEVVKEYGKEQSE
jgi:metal-responsive CopG/Arc/MetJ family transcriptional regulator